MKILALEFSSPQRSVAVLNLSSAGQVLAAAEVLESAPGNAMKPLGMVAAALRRAGLAREEIDSIALGLGPGSYTGIRAGIALAQGWSLGREVKLLGISSAEAIAAGAVEAGLPGVVSVVIDAQRQEFYLENYRLDESGACKTAPLRITGRDEIEGLAGNLIGPEVTKWFPNGRTIYPRAAIIARLAAARSDSVAGEKLEPIYLRETTFVKAPPPRALPL